MSYASCRTVKATRKPHTCEGCVQQIETGSPAFYWAGDCDGEFYAAYYHAECRRAELAFNDMKGQDGDEFDSLCLIRDEPDDIAWLIAEFPNVAERMGLTNAPVRRMPFVQEEL